MRWFVVVNRSAGTGRSVALRAQRALDRVGVDYDLALPSGRQEAAGCVQDAADAGQRHFVAVGGDGTVNLVVNSLLDRPWSEPPVLGVLPGGTGCDLIRTFGISQKMEEAAGHLARPGEYVIDVGFVEGEWGRRFFVNVAEAGVAAAAVQSADRLPAALGRVRYPLGLALALPTFNRTGVTIDAGKRTFRGEALAVIFANGQFFGGGFNIAPKATLIDGVLDVQVITAAKRRAPSLVPRIYRGMHLTDRDVKRFVTSRVTVESDQPWPVEVDGEYLGNTPVSAGVQSGRIALKI